MEGAEAANIQELMTGPRFVNPEAERSVLGAMLRSRQAAQAGLDGLVAGDFFDPGNREIFDAMRSVADGGQAVDLITVDQELIRRGKLEVVGGAAYLIELTQGVPSAANVGAYIGIVKGLAKRRAAIQAAEALAQGLKDPAADVDAVLSQLRDAADGLENGGKLRLVPLDEVNIDTYDYLDRRTRGEIKALPTGIRSVDGIIGGLFGGEMTVVAARPSVGKTAFGLNIAMNAAKDGFKVVFVSCEMGKEGLGQRTLSRGAYVSGDRLRKAEIEPDDWEALQNAMVEMTGMPFQFIFNDPANPEPITVEGVFETVRDAARHGVIDLLVVDYIGIMGTRKEFKENWLKVAYISRELKRLAMAANIPVVALCQVNRMAQGKMPTMAELAQSGAVEQDADGIIFLHRPESHEDRSVNPKDVAGFYAMQEAGSVYISISVAKQRNGSIGTVNVMFDPNVMRYNEIMRE